MENRYVLFHVALVLNILILVVSFTGVMSLPLSQPNITEVMKNDPNLCDASKFLYESEYTKFCALLPYPTASLNINGRNLDIFFCLAVYDTAYKICQYSSQSHQIPSFNTALLIPYLKGVLNAIMIEEKEKEICNNLQNFTLSYNKTDSLLKPLVEELNKSHKCQKICFDLSDRLMPLCAIFTWIKKFDDIKKTNKTEIKQLVTPDLVISNETASNNRSKLKVSEDELKETTEQNKGKIINISKNNNDKETNFIVPQNVSLVHAEKVKSDSEKSSKTHKKSDINLKASTHKSSSPMLDEDKKNVLDKFEPNNRIVNLTKTIPTNNNMQAPSMNNVPKKDVNEEKGEEQKEQNIDDLKTSTLSENTQDHYDAKNPEDVETNLDSNIEEADDTIQQSTRNQNENVQELFEQKNLRYPNIRTEDDSHFFTYFTVVTVACIAGYIGYHNKQKILAIVLEGRRSRSNRSRRRPSTANYRKLDCTLEEAVTSQCNANVTHVIY